MRFLGPPLVVAVLLGAGPARGFAWPNQTARAEQNLSSPDPSVRRGAAVELLGLPEAAARRLAKKALVDQDEEVRLSAAAVVLDFGLPEAGELVVSWLSDPDRRLRRAATDVLRVHPSPRAVAALGRSLSDADEEIRASAAEALGRSGSTEAVMPLLGHLDDAVPAVRLAVVRALARLADGRAIVPLIGKVQDPRESVRRAVVHALGELRDVRAESAVVLALRDTDADVRVAALGALGKLKSAASLSSIVPLLASEKQAEVRAAALGALGRIGSERALDAVIDALDSESADDRAVALDVAVRLGPTVKARLDSCLQGRGTGRRAVGCASALAALRTGVSPEVIIAAQRRGALGKVAALGALGALGDARGLASVLEHLGDGDPVVRSAAIEAAALLLDPAHPDGRAIEPIERALDQARAGGDERRALVVLLGRTGSPRAKERLLAFAHAEGDILLRLAAIEALGQIGPAGQDAALMSALDDERATVRLTAALALRRSAAAASAGPLLDRLSRTARQDRHAVLLALAGALERSTDERVLRRAMARLRATRDAERDGMLEAIGRMRAAWKDLAALARGASSVPDRVKIAEALAAHPVAEQALRELAQDADGAVRANAVWGLGVSGSAGSAKVLVSAIADRDVAVAGNAVAALGRLALRVPGTPVDVPLCRATADTRSAVRAAALVALRGVARRCGDGSSERALVATDRSEEVRRSAALLVRGVPSTSPLLDARSVEQCAEEDPSGSVAVACVERGETRLRGEEPVTVYVVPPGDTSPRARAPFALVLADGSVRLGITDRRGAVFEAAAPRGPVRLGVPAPLLR